MPSEQVCVYQFDANNLSVLAACFDNTIRLDTFFNTIAVIKI